MPQLVYDGRTYPLTDGEIILGRHRESQLFVHDGRASRQHARVYRTDVGAWCIEDLDSANGTRVNSQEIFSPHHLVHGDIVSIGKARVWFVSEVDTEDATPAQGSPVLPSEVTDPLIGATCGACKVLARIGAGSTGTVYQAEMLSTGRIVALRLYHADLAQRDQAFPERMLDTIRAAARFTHPGAVPIFDCGVIEQRPWYAMELVEGESLADLVDRDGRLEPARAVDLMHQAATVLAAAQAQHLSHLTLGPSSILVGIDGRIRVSDLGLGAALHGATDRRRPAGNAWYAAPERRAGEVGDARSDIFSLGCIFYHVLVGDAPNAESELAKEPALERTAPAEASTPTVCDKLPALPKRVDEIISGALARLPAWRYSSMHEFAADLERLKDLLAVPGKGRAAKVAPQPRSVTAAPELNRQPGTPVAPVAGRRANAARPQGTPRTPWLLWGIVVTAIGLVAVWFGVINRPNSEAKVNAIMGPFVPFHPRDGGEPTGIPPPSEKMSKATEPAGANDPALLRGRWTAIEEQVARYAVASAWPRIDKSLKEFNDSIPASAPSDVVEAVSRLRKNMHLRSEAWYRDQIATLPQAASPRWATLNRLYDQVPSSHRSEISSLLRETEVKLDQEVTVLRTKASRLLEDGRFDSLVALAGTFRSLPPGAVVGKRVQALRAQLAEIMPLKARWAGTWAATRQAMVNPDGEDALTVGAALLLTSNDADGQRLLNTIPDSDLFSLRRDRLLGRPVTELSFTVPEDIQALEIIQGEPRLAENALTAPAGAPCGISCITPLAGKTWRVELVMEAKTTSTGPAQVAASLVGEDGKALIQLRITPDTCAIKVTTAAGLEQFQPAAPAPGALRLRFDCKEGALTIRSDEETLAETTQVALPNGSHLQVEVSGMEWRITAIRIVGAP